MNSKEFQRRYSVVLSYDIKNVKKGLLWNKRDIQVVCGARSLYEGDKCLGPLTPIKEIELIKGFNLNKEKEDLEKELQKRLSDYLHVFPIYRNGEHIAGSDIEVIVKRM